MTGLTDKEVAEEMAIATDTVRNYWKRIRSKVGGSSRAEIIATMVRRGMIEEIQAKQSENEILMSEIAKRRVAEQERQRLLIELEQERSWLQAVLQQMPFALTILEAPTGRLVLWNPTFEAMIDAPADSFTDADGRINLRGRDLSGASLGQEGWPHFRSLHRGESVDSQWIELECGGAWRKVSVSTGPIRDRSGNIIAAIAMWRAES